MRKLRLMAPLVLHVFSSSRWPLHSVHAPIFDSTNTSSDISLSLSAYVSLCLSLSMSVSLSLSPPLSDFVCMRHFFRIPLETS